jgi:multidrug resistance efflux pump
LVISKQETKTGVFFVFKDPLRTQFFRFGEAEYFIARQLDGSTPFELIRERVEEKFRSALAPETLREFVESLRRLGLLESDEIEARTVARRQFTRGSLLYLRLKAFDPDWILGRLSGKLRFFFTPQFIVFSAFVIICALTVTVVNWSEITGDLRSLWRFDALPLAWATVLVVTGAHEFAHGLTCKRFGGQVHEMGFMLIYFQPAFYCNVSDAWLFPNKSHRLWVTLSGAYFEIFIWSLATLTWWVVEPGTWASFLCLVVMATSGIKELFNMNPLIKLDGYYLVSDYLEIPNLRWKAFNYVRVAVKRLWGSAKQSIQVATRREQRIYLIYGLLAIVYSYWILAWITLQFGNYLVGRYQGVGFFLFSGLLMATFQNPLGRALPRLTRLFGSTPKKLAVMRPHVKWIIPIVVMALLLFGRLELRISGEFNVLPGHNSDVRAAVEGIIEEVYVNEGDWIEKGKLLARLSDRDYQAELAKLEAEINEKRATLKMLQAGPRPEEIELAKKEVETAGTRHMHSRQQYEEAKRIHATRLARSETATKTAEERLQYAGKDLDRLQGLFQIGIASRKQLEDSQESARMREKELEIARVEWQLVSEDNLADLQKELAVAQKQVEEAEGRLRVLRAGSRTEAIEAMEAEIVRLESQQRYVMAQLRQVHVMSPASGVVTTPKPKEKVGQHVEQGDLIVEVFELQKVRPEVAISEKEIADVRVGQPVVLKARAYPEKSFSGRVAAIAPIAQVDALQRKTVRVTIDMDEPTDLLKPEMTGNAKVFCGKRRIFELLTRRFARYIRVEFWSWW